MKFSPTPFGFVPIDDTKPSYNPVTEMLIQSDVEREGSLVRVWVVVPADHWIANAVDAVRNIFS